MDPPEGSQSAPSSPAKRWPALHRGKFGSERELSRSVTGATPRPSSQDFSHQIQQLEAEGRKLMASTHSLGDPLLGPSFGRSSLSHGMVGRTSTSSLREAGAASLFALADISEEQKTISELRANLEARGKETERLQQELLGDSRRSLGAGRSAPMTSVLSSLDIPTSSYSTFSAANPSSSLPPSTTRRSYDYNMPQSHLERQLKASQEEIVDLRNKVREAIRLSEEQKSHFRATIEDLKSQLNAALTNRDSVLELRQRESAGQEALITRLQSNIEQLEEANRVQEETLLGMNAKMETLQKDQYIGDTLTGQLRSILLDREQKRGKPFYEAESITQQGVTMLSHSLERCIHELEADIETKHHHIKELTSELDRLRASSQDRQQLIVKDHQERLTQLSEQHEKELNAAVERSVHARKQATTLQEQLSMLQQQSEHQIRLKDDHIQELEDRLKRLQEEKDKEAASWGQRREALELAMDQVQKEAAQVKLQREDAVHKASNIEGRFDELQQTITRLEGELDSEREQISSLAMKEAEARQKVENMAADVKEKEKQIEMLEKSLSIVKQECDTQLQHTVASIEKEEKNRAADQILSLQEKVSSLTDKYNDHKLELEVLKAEHKNLVGRHDALQTEHGELKTKAETMGKSRDQLSQSLEERIGDVERLTQERDSYFKMLGDRDKEMTTLRGEVDKLTIQLEERERNFTTLKEQNENMTQITETNTAEAKTLKEDRDRYMKQMNDKIVETEELRHARDNILRKLRVREKHLKDLEEDNVKMAEALQERKDEMEQIIKDKDAIYNELKEVQSELANLAEDRDHLQRAAEECEAELQQEIKKYNTKLKATEHDLKLSRRALRTHEEVDGKAVRVAGKMQKEVTEKRGQIDSLQSRLHWFEESLEAVAKERKMLKEENDKLTTSLRKSVQQNERVTSDLELAGRKNKDYRDRVSKLEAALEKAAVKHAAAKAQLEQFEQDMARLKLKHQLELKELERTGQLQLSKQLHIGTEDQKTSGTGPGRSGVTLASLSPATVDLLSRATAKGNDLEYPVSQKPTQTQVENLVAENGVGQELRALLGEMRSLIYGQQRAQMQQNSRQGTGDSEEHAGHTRPHQEKLRDYDSPSDGGKEVPKRQTTHKDMYKGRARSRHHGKSSSHYPVVSSPVKRKAPFQVSTPIKTSTRPTSDKEAILSDLMLSSNEKDDDQADTESLSSAGTIHSNTSIGSIDKLDLHPPAATDANNLYQKLEKKLESLSKLGANLEQENKELSELLKKEDRKLRKAKQNEKRVQRSSRK